jgi:hypothetical protein
VTPFSSRLIIDSDSKVKLPLLPDELICLIPAWNINIARVLNLSSYVCDNPDSIEVASIPNIPLKFDPNTFQLEYEGQETTEYWECVVIVSVSKRGATENAVVITHGGQLPTTGEHQSTADCRADIDQNSCVGIYLGPTHLCGHGRGGSNLLPSLEKFDLQAA